MNSDLALEAVRAYSDAGNPSAYLAFNQGNSYFSRPGIAGLIVYRATGRYLVQFGGPFTPAADRPEMIKAFDDFAARAGREIVAVQLQAADAEPYLDQGYTVNQLGASYAVDLDTFTLQGTRFMQLRNKISRALRNGLVIQEVSYQDWQAEIEELDAAWLTIKGEGVNALDFLVGETGGPHQDQRRLLIGRIDGRLAGYISYSPVYGSRSGWMHDLSRRRPDVGPGVMEAINRQAIDLFRAEGVRWLHFGFTPFTSLDFPPLPGHSKAFHWFMSYLWEQGEHIYPARTQLAYKEKWAPSLILPEYIAFRRQASLPALVHMFRACNAI